MIHGTTNKISTVKKNDKPFKPLDMLLYAVIVLLTVILFLAFVIIPKSKNYKGFNVYLDNEKILSYNYLTKNVTVSNGYENLVLVNEQNGEITVYTSDTKKDFNVLLIDNIKNTVSVKDTNCKNKDCMRFNGGYIYCAPHKLLISSFGTESEIEVG